ncbi:MAG: Methionyl-tRNA formyltransferase [Chlamydiae bacterium]|nr:Methionyl-tRNA formyltransferase [Chlamydiota bacterium]
MQKSAIILGSKPASVAALLLLKKRGWIIKEVVASKNQAEWIPGPSLEEVARNLGIRVVHNQLELESEEVDLVISYMNRTLVKPKTLARGKVPLNFHAGPLPRFGGWAFYSVAILENSDEYGCTCHVMDDSFDTGPIVKVRTFEINPRTETAYSLEKKAQFEMLLLFQEIISYYEKKGNFLTKDQKPTELRYMNYKEFSNLKEIPLTASKEEIDRIARAFWYPPYEMAYFRTEQGAKVEVIPELVKNELAQILHNRDLKNSLTVLGISDL